MATSKHNIDLESSVVSWVETVCAEKKGHDTSVAQWLKNGQILCKLANAIRPGIVKRVNNSQMPFKQMENITFFMNAARELGVPESALFGTPDLYEEKNIGSVVKCIYSLGGAIQVSCPSFQGPLLGVAVNVESKDKKRESRGLLVDQSSGFSTSMDVARPTERADYCVRPVHGPTARARATSSSVKPVKRETPSVTVASAATPLKCERPPLPATKQPKTEATPPMQPSPVTQPAPAMPETEDPGLGQGQQDQGHGKLEARAKSEEQQEVKIGGSTSSACAREAPRASASGMDRELQKKLEAKFGGALERDVTTWVQQITGVQRGEESIAAWLKNGQVLCMLANCVRPGIVKKVNSSQMPFKQMENITFFMHAARALGVPESAMFGTPDLYEERNVPAVINCLYSFGCAVQVSCPDFRGPSLGVAMNVEAKARKRQSGLLVDQSAGLSTAMEVHRPGKP